MASLVGLAFLVAAIVLAVIIAAPGLLGAEASYVVKSDSMSPAIGAGDVAVLSSADAESLESGTVITFTSGSNRVTHRIVAVERTADGIRYQTKGDANENPDGELVAPSQVLGKLWFSVPMVGYLVTFANTGLGLIALVVVPALALVASELYAIYAETAQSKDDGGDGP